MKGKREIKTLPRAMRERPRDLMDEIEAQSAGRTLQTKMREKLKSKPVPKPKKRGKDDWW